MRAGGAFLEGDQADQCKAEKSQCAPAIRNVFRRIGFGEPFDRERAIISRYENPINRLAERNEFTFRSVR